MPTDPRLNERIEFLNDRELSLLNSVETEFNRASDKRAAIMAMMMASHDLGAEDTINLLTGEIVRK